MTEIRIYIEGGGDSKNNKTKLREGFSQFLQALRLSASQNHIGWRLIACGSRNEAYGDFCTALTAHTNALNVLLVDAEEALTAKTLASQNPVWTHLQTRDKWICPAGATERNCFLMVQSMETWIIADRDNLKKFYGIGFNENALPKNQNLESVGKTQIMDALNRATAQTKTKGKYHKTNHGFDLIKGLNPATVRAAAPSCERLFDELIAVLENNTPPD